MTEACSGGGAGMMALVGIDDATVEKVCQEQREAGKKYTCKLIIWMDS